MFSLQCEGVGLRGKMRGVKSWQKPRVQPLGGVRPGLTEAALGGETLVGESARFWGWIGWGRRREV